MTSYIFTIAGHPISPDHLSLVSVLKDCSKCGGHQFVQKSEDKDKGIETWSGKFLAVVVSGNTCTCELQLKYDVQEGFYLTSDEI